MEALIRELLPNAPHMGLFVAPNIPAERLKGALGDYARSVSTREVIALYDATLLGNGRDGAVFTPDRLVFQNNNLEPTHTVHYASIVGVESRRKLLGGRKVELQVNEGRATIALTMDFSGKAGAATYVARLLTEVMLRGAAQEMDTVEAPSGTDVEAVEEALDRLHRQGLLTDEDRTRLLNVLRK